MNNKVLFGPYYIFIKGLKEDSEVMKLLNMKDYILKSKKMPFNGGFLESGVCITENNNWKHIIDGWSYEMWQIQERNHFENIRKVGKNYELFSFMVGDSDETLEYSYYKGGSLIREYRYRESISGEVLLKKSFGKPLPSENASFDKKSENYTNMLNIAESIGIKFSHNISTLNLYEHKYD